ncbi:hypothetical protein Pcinc_025063, partial [Petrolisthes cinctipes]
MALGPFSVTYIRSQFADYSEILYWTALGYFCLALDSRKTYSASLSRFRG